MSTTSDSLVVLASVPANHVYVRHLAAVAADDGVIRLPDPLSPARSAVSPWWPPVMLEPGWITSNQADFDVLHLHFGFDALSPESLRDVVAELRRASKPFVYTVHDLRNPHHSDTDLHDRQLGVLIHAADAVITLTPGAAEEIRTRWGRDARVLPHPHVVPLEHVGEPRAGSDAFVVGVHVKSLRANMRPLPVVDALTTVVAQIPGGSLRVDAHTDVMAGTNPRFDPDLAKALVAHAEAGRLELAVHDYFSDDQLWQYLRALDVSVLPYAFGTHSGWLEACYDLGTSVVAPAVGYYAQQHPVSPYRWSGTQLDAPSLGGAVWESYRRRKAAERGAESGRPFVATPARRLEERAMLAREHRRIYQGLLR